MASLFRRVLALLGLARSDEDWVYPGNAITRAVEAMLAEPETLPASEAAAPEPVPGAPAEAAAVAEAEAPRKRKRLRRRSRRADAA